MRGRRRSFESDVYCSFTDESLIAIF